MQHSGWGRHSGKDTLPLCRFWLSRQRRVYILAESAGLGLAGVDAPTGTGHKKRTAATAARAQHSHTFHVEPYASRRSARRCASLTPRVQRLAAREIKFSSSLSISTQYDHVEGPVYPSEVPHRLSACAYLRRDHSLGPVDLLRWARLGSTASSIVAKVCRRSARAKRSAAVHSG